MKEGREENIDLLKEWTNPNVWCSTLFLSFKSIQNYLTRINPCCYGRSVYHFTYATTHAQIHIHKHNSHTGFTLEEWEMERTILTLYQWRDHTRREKMLFYIVEMAFTFRLYGGARYHESKYG